MVLGKDGEDQLDHHVRNEEVLLRVNEQRNILHEIRKQKDKSYVETAFYNKLLKER